MKLTKKTAGAGLATAAAAVLVGSGAYAASPGSAPASAATSVSADTAKPADKAKPGARAKVRGLRGIHGEATVRRGDDKFGQVGWQRGQVTAVTSTGLTVRSADGTAWNWTAAKNIRVRKDRKKATLSAVQSGDTVVVFGPHTGDTRTARAVVVRPKS